MRGFLPIRKNPFYILVSPYALVILIYIPIFLIYLTIPSELFEVCYGESKAIDASWQVVYIINVLMLFGLGGYLGTHLLLKAKIQKGETVLLPIWFIRGGLIVSLLAYLLWLGLGVHRAGGIGNLTFFYLEKPYYLKSVILATVPGITTLTQVAVAAIPLMISYKRIGRGDRLLIGLILFFATLRSFLYSERLALLELLVPIAFLVLSAKSIKWKKAFSYILIFVVFVTSFFILNESRRSFIYHEWISVWNLIETGLLRFLGYYLTSVNNAIFFINNLSFATPLYNTFQVIWRFPGLNDVYNSFTGINPIYAPQILNQHGLNPEFNTATSIGYWVVDFGLIGTFFVAFFFGFFSGVLYYLSSKNRCIAALYSVWLVGLLEFMRIQYFTTTRLLPAYLLFIMALFLVSKVNRTSSKHYLRSNT